jgi:hypothetical protein
MDTGLVVDNVIQDLQNLTLSNFVSSDIGFKFKAIFMCLIFMAFYLYSQNKKALKSESTMKRYLKMGVDIPDGIKLEAIRQSGLGISSIGFWITAISGCSLLIIMFLM